MTLNYLKDERSRQMNISKDRQEAKERGREAENEKRNGEKKKEKLHAHFPKSVR